MKKIFLTLTLILFGCNLITAQTIEEQIAADPNYISHKEKVIKFYNSEDNIKEYNISNDFREKTKNCKNSDPYKYQSNFEEWLTKNLAETDFKTVEEGVKLNNERRAINKKNEVIKKEIAAEFNKLSKTYDSKILTTYFFEDVMTKL